MPETRVMWQVALSLVALGLAYGLWMLNDVLLAPRSTLITVGWRVVIVLVAIKWILLVWLPAATPAPTPGETDA